MMTQSVYDSWFQEMLFEQNSYASSRPALGLYVGIILLYILAVLPGLFFYLRKKDRMHYLRELLIMTALLFSAVIFVLGAKTRLTAPALNYVRVLDQRGAACSETIYISVKIPYRQRITAVFDGSYQATLLDDQVRQNGFKWTKGLTLQQGEGDISISTGDCPAVTPMYLMLCRTWTSDQGAELGAVSFREASQIQDVRLQPFLDTLAEDTTVYVGLLESDAETFILQADQWDVSGITLVLRSDGGSDGD